MLFGESSCKKENTTDFVEQAKIVAGYVKSEDIMADLFVLFHKVLHDTILINKGEDKIDSALVTCTQNSGTVGAQFYFDYGPAGKICPDGKLRNGQINAVLNKSFDQADAVFTANFANYEVDGTILEGQYSYVNTGQSFAGKLKYKIIIEFSFFSNLNKTLSVSDQRDMFWKSGYDKPYNTINHVFEMPVGAIAQYYGNEGIIMPLATLAVNSISDWIIQFSCPNPIKQGNFKVSVDYSKGIIQLNGDFIDVDEDGCADKIIIKNSDNSFGYPYYL